MNEISEHIKRFIEISRFVQNDSKIKNKNGNDQQ